MRTLLILLAFAGQAFAAEIPEATVARIVDAIGKAENSVKYPYGVKSINTHGNVAYARRICENTVRACWGRYERQTIYTNFVEFLGSRYCPVQGDKTGLNKNWVKNVNYFLTSKP